MIAKNARYVKRGILVLMPSLSLQDARDVSAFLNYIRIFLPKELFEDVDTCLALVNGNNPDQKIDWIGRLKRLASHAWPVRMGARIYATTTDGVRAEHELLVAHARPTTAFLLRRLHRIYPDMALEEIAETTHGRAALTEREREELGALRPEVHGMLVRASPAGLDALIQQKKEDMDRLLRVFRQARLLAERLPDREARLAEIESWEDRVLFGGEHPDESELLPLISFQQG